MSFIPREAQVALGVAVFYGATSITISLLNKALLSSYHFDGYFTILLCQLTFSGIFCWISRTCFGNPFDIPPMSIDLAKKALPLGVLYSLNIGVGLLALQMVNVPMFNSLRKLVAPIILIYEYIVYNKVAESGIQLSIGVVVVGVVLAGWETFDANFVGYIMTMFNNMLTAASAIMQKQFSTSTKMSTFGIVYCNACVAAPITFLFCLVTGEFSKLSKFENLYDPGFQVSLGICSAMGLLITYSTMLCTVHNSPLATSVTGNIKDVLTTILGWILFPGFTATASSVMGVFLAFFGGFMYSYVGLMNARKQAVPAPITENTSANVEVVTHSAGNASHKSQEHVNVNHKL